MECYLAIKKEWNNAICSNNLEIIILSEVTHIEKKKFIAIQNHKDVNTFCIYIPRTANILISDINGRQKSLNTEIYF